MNNEIAQASAEWLGSVEELEEEIAAARSTAYVLETKLRMHIVPAYLADDAARKLLGGLLASLDAAKARIAIAGAVLAEHRAAQATAAGIVRALQAQ